MAPSPTDSFPFYSGPSATLPGITSSQPDNPVGLFIVLLLLAIFFAGGTCVFIWKLYVRGPAYSKRPIRPLVEEDEDSLGKVSPPKQFVLPSLLYSKDFTVLSTSPEKKRRSIFDYLPTMFKRDSRNAILETPSTDKEGEFVLVEAPIPGGDVPSIIVSTCSPSVRKLDIGPSVSSDSLQVPSGRFVAPRPTPPVLLQQPQQPQTPTRPHPLRIIGDYNNRSGLVGGRNDFNGHHNFSSVDISALGFRTRDYNYISVPKRGQGQGQARGNGISRGSSSGGKENAPPRNGGRNSRTMPSHARSMSGNSYRHVFLRAYTHPA